MPSPALRPILVMGRLGLPGWGRAALVAAALAVAASLAAVGMHVLGPRNLEPVDLRVYLAGAAAIVHRAPLYRAGFDSAQRLPFTYPPVAAVLMVPLSILGERLLSVLWDAGSLGALAYALHRVMGRPGWAGVLAATALALVTQPVFDNLSLGQVDILFMAAAVAGGLATNPIPGPPGGLGSRPPSKWCRAFSCSTCCSPAVGGRWPWPPVPGRCSPAAAFSSGQRPRGGILRTRSGRLADLGHPRRI